MLLTTAIILAAGQGRRMQASCNKLLLPLQEQPILVHTLLQLSQAPLIDDFILVLAQKDIEYITELLLPLQNKIKPYQIVLGGKERQDSVANALSALQERSDTDILLIHDAARPFVAPELISDIIKATEKYEAAIPALPAIDTIKQVSDDLFITTTIPRASIYLAQTPQGFKKGLLCQAYAQAKKDNFLGTDDASLVERLHHPVKIIPGRIQNIKLTQPADLQKAEFILSQAQAVFAHTNTTTKKGRPQRMQMQVGTGYDVHRLVAGRKLIIGGVNIPYEYGLLGHSDADVLLHAISDALLGASSLGDIGKYFPDTDERFKNISSLLLLKEVGKLLSKNHFRINNIDSTIIAQKPKLASYIPKMRQNIAVALSLSLEQVNVKATTEEGLGFTGEGKGIAAQAAVLLEKNAQPTRADI